MDLDQFSVNASAQTSEAGVARGSAVTSARWRSSLEGAAPSDPRQDNSFQKSSIQSCPAEEARTGQKTSYR